MTAPTKASLQRELRAMTKRAEEAERRNADDVAKAMQWGHRMRSERDEARMLLHNVRLALRPVLAYFGEQWIGDRVRKEYQELVRFAKGQGDE